MRRGNNNWWIWIVLFIILGGGMSFLLPLFLIIAVVVGIALASVSAYKKSDATSGFQQFSSYKRKEHYQRSETESSKVAKINIYLRKYFRTRKSVNVVDSVELRLRDEQYASLSSLDVYRNNAYICSFNDYHRRYPESYQAILNDLLRLVSNAPIQDEVIDAEVVENPQPKQQEKPKTSSDNAAQSFIDEINHLNNDIPDEEISNGLYETCALLKQIQTLEEKFPNSKDKLKKLYEYYLPILTKILKQYRNLQYAKTDSAYEETREKLTKTIHLINDAMGKIISSMTDEDFINLSADISTLEAVLKKDGLTDEGTMKSTNR